MRGLKSTIALAGRADRAGRVHLLRRLEEAGLRAAETKAKAFTVEADQIEEIQIKPAAGRGSRAAEDERHVAAGRARKDGCRPGPAHECGHEPRVRSRSTASSTTTRLTSRSTA